MTVKAWQALPVAYSKAESPDAVALSLHFPRKNAAFLASLLSRSPSLFLSFEHQDARNVEAFSEFSLGMIRAVFSACAATIRQSLYKL